MFVLQTEFLWLLTPKTKSRKMPESISCDENVVVATGVEHLLSFAQYNFPLQSSSEINQTVSFLQLNYIDYIYI